jgi:DNA-binding MarR family transcriptional regulator
MASKTSPDDLLEFHGQIVNLVKKYQFRDRNQITCFGVSVSQCYVMETLHALGPLTMHDLARKMYLSVSTLTRVVATLVAKGFVERHEAPEDRRVRLVRLTARGESVRGKCWDNVLRSEKMIFENVPRNHRASVIRALARLNQAVDRWHARCDGS